MVAPLKLNVRLPRVRVYSVEPLRGLVKPRNKLREFGTDDLCRGRLVEVAAGGLAQSAHDLAHLLLGRGTQLGDNLLNQASSSSPETCAGSRLSRILTCSVRLSVRSWSVPA